MRLLLRIRLYSVRVSVPNFAFYTECLAPTIVADTAAKDVDEKVLSRVQPLMA